MTTQRHHRFDYIELAAPDLARAEQFYAAAFGWKFNDYGPDYSGIQGASPEDPEVGGLTPHATPGRSGPLVQLYSDNLEATVDAIGSAGGEVIQGPYGFPGGRRLHFLDPAGNELGVWSES